NATGSLGAGNAPFDPSAGGDLRNDMRLAIPLARLNDRRYLLNPLDGVRWHLAEARQLEGMDRLREQALQTVLGGAAEAFDLSKEDPRVVGRYDTAPLVRPDAIDRKWNNYNNYVD